jgi:hypothetical protein
MTVVIEPFSARPKGSSPHAATATRQSMYTVGL